tara:strand:+ start:2620 stop:2748 length:129 start_codon:yes stop_codon:yes gene_type:complete
MNTLTIGTLQLTLAPGLFTTRLTPEVEVGIGAMVVGLSLTIT